jgi:transcriptional regulator with XRE-family HTH domain
MSLAYDYSCSRGFSRRESCRVLDLKPLRMRAFTTDISSASPPGDVSMLLWHSASLRQTSNLLDWQDDDFVRCKLPDLASPLKETGTGVNKEAARENLYEARRLTGFTWDELAALLEVDRRTLHNWTQGGPVRDANQTRLAELLGVLRYADRGSAEANRLALNKPDASGVTPLGLMTRGRFQEAQIALGRGAGRPALPLVSGDALVGLRTRALGLGYFSDSETDGESEEGPQPPPQPARSRRIPMKRG